MADIARTRLRVKSTGAYVKNFGATASTDLSGDPLSGGQASLNPYETANGTGRRSQAWRTAAWGPNVSVQWGLTTLRNQTRDQVRKNGLARSAVDSMVANIVGTGIKPQSKAKDDNFRTAFDALFLKWTDEADSTGTLDFYGLQSLAVRGMIDGDSFTRIRSRRLSDGLSVPIQLQLMEGDQCPHFFGDGDKLQQGIEYDALGKRVAFWFYPSHPGDLPIGTVTDMQPGRVPAEQVAHLYRPLRPGQARGEPWLAAALAQIFTLGKYLDAELVRKQTAAMFTGFIKKVAGGLNPMGSDDADVDGSAGVQFEPGTLQVLEDDEDITFSAPTDVGSSFEAFVREAKRGIAIAAGVLYEELSGDYSTLNDRTMRAAFNAFRRKVEMYQHHLVVFQWCRPIINQWVDAAIASGALVIPPGMDPADAYSVKWIPQGWPYIHPVQDVEGKALEVETGFSTRSMIVSGQGYNSADIDKENAADNARADALGLKYTSDGRQNVAPDPAIVAPPTSGNA